MKKINIGFSISLIITLVLLASLSVDYYVTSYDATNVSVLVNITNAGPEIIAVSINGGISSIDLNQGSTKTVECNFTVRDYNGYADIIYLNASLFRSNESINIPLDNNTKYYLETPTCTNTSQDTNTAIYSCKFPVEYFAYNGSWTCNASVYDNTNYNATGQNTTYFNALYAMDLPSQIDFGNMAVGDTSLTSEIANVTNFGNVAINISVYGYGGNNELTANAGDYAFFCEHGNITIDNLKYNITDDAWTNMISLTNTSTNISGLTVQNQHTETSIFNSTYWRLYVPPNPFGQCNGTIVFEAQIP